MGKDLLSDRYGRFFEIPEELAKRGHEVVGLTLAYHRRTRHPPGFLVTESGVRWQAVDGWPRLINGLVRYYVKLKELLAVAMPDVIIGGSDAFHAVVAHRISRRTNIPAVIDLYDQFEAYGGTRLPAVRTLFRSAVATADGVTCVSPRLREWACSLRGANSRTYLLGNAVSVSHFFPRDRAEARRRLALPEKSILIGTAGALTRERDVGTLYEAFQILRSRLPATALIVAGSRDVPPPRAPDVYDLGLLEHAEIPWLFSALDVGVVCNPDSVFARYCHPQKMLEMHACGLRTVVSDALSSDLEGLRPNQVFYRPGDARVLAEAVITALDQPELRSAAPRSWSDQAERLEAILEESVAAVHA